MKILSIDVGIKNLACCIIETKPDMMFKIEKWEVINLCGEHPTCCFNTKKGICGNKSKYCKNDVYYCRIHSKKSEFLVPTSELLKIKLKRTKISTLLEIAKKYDINIDGDKSLNKSLNKSLITEKIIKYTDEKMLEPVKEQSANNMNLVSIGILLKNELEKYSDIQNVDQIVIENQISPIANRMKSIQGMIAQYFIMKNITNIDFVSSSNKLKEFIGDQKTTYAERKKIGVNITKDILAKNPLNMDWLPFVSKHKKKDDLADSLLQGLWFLRNKKLIKIE